jgi:integrase
MRRTRGQGEGCISRRKDGRWEARISLGWNGGKRRVKVYYGKTRQEVQEKLNGGLTDKGKGLLLREKGQTVERFLTRWLEESVKPTWRPTTYARYSTLVRLRLIPFLGRIALDKLTPQQVQAMYVGMTPTAARYARTVLRAALTRAMKWDLVVRNAAALSEPPRAPRQETHYLDPEQAKALLAAAQGHKDEALFVTALMCGLRRGELLGLRWQDVDLDAGRAIRVRNALHRVRLPGGLSSSLVLDELKTEKSKRTIGPLPAQVVAALLAHRHRQTDGIQRLPVATGYVFASSNGGPMDPQALLYHFKRLLTKAGLPDFRFHDLRHSCASILLAAGVPPKVIQEMLGHSQISTTMNIYAHVMPNLRQEAADAMDAAFGGATS